jgi:lipopolysaccharide/colanic/teichoic acid biosynthesis glycosyltransferase
MRYLNPVSNPLAHYWEEELAGFWGIWLRFRERGRRLLGNLLGEVILANLYMISELVVNQTSFIVLRSRLASIFTRINSGAIVKRTIDIIGAIVGLAISAPLWIIIPLAIKLDSKGPVLYFQERVGQDRRRRNRRGVLIDSRQRRTNPDRRTRRSHGRPFGIVKFRTMCRDAEKQSGPVWAIHDDPRITRVGHILRKTRFDEIPQLLNVLAGDMSLVGPRPERPYFVERLDGTVKDYRNRFKVKPGITGLAQVEHKYDENLDDVNFKVKYDLTYIGNWNLTQDIKILLKTVIVVLTARGM